jgi:hypothetical protein
MSTFSLRSKVCRDSSTAICSTAFRLVSAPSHRWSDEGDTLVWTQGPQLLQSYDKQGEKLLISGRGVGPKWVVVKPFQVVYFHIIEAHDRCTRPYTPGKKCQTER